VASPRVLTKRALNRALLERQLLQRRRPTPPLEAVERLVALQSQVPRDPYVALWSGSSRSAPRLLSDALEERRAVRMTCSRTLHLVTAATRSRCARWSSRSSSASSPARRRAGMRSAAWT
jgi:hypothetical protein